MKGFRNSEYCVPSKYKNGNTTSTLDTVTCIKTFQWTSYHCQKTLCFFTIFKPGRKWNLVFKQINCEDDVLNWNTFQTFQTSPGLFIKRQFYSLHFLKCFKHIVLYFSFFKHDVLFIDFIWITIQEDTQTN